MKKKFKRSFDQLDRVFDFVSTFIKKNRIGTSATHAINLAVEEIFTNMVKYNPDNKQEIQIDLQLLKQYAFITMTDYEAQPFDLTATKVYDLEQSVQDRPIGKLGLHLVKKVMDKIEYSHTNGKTIIKMVKHLGEQNA